MCVGRLASGLQEYNPIILCQTDTQGKCQALHADVACRGRAKRVQKMGVGLFSILEARQRLVAALLIDHNDLERCLVVLAKQ